MKKIIFVSTVLILSGCFSDRTGDGDKKIDTGTNSQTASIVVTNAVLIFIISTVLILSGCFSDWAGDGYITIGPGTESQTARIVVTDAEVTSLRHDYILNGPGCIIH
jgi:protein involved in sex pheromone biosynthesis